MESMYFSAFVLGMCALHLMFQASGRVDNWLRRHTPQAGKTAEKNGRKPQRDDWYAFFHCADLVGKEPAGKRTQPEISSGRVPDRKDRRPPRASIR